MKPTNLLVLAIVVLAAIGLAVFLATAPQPAVEEPAKVEPEPDAALPAAPASPPPMTGLRTVGDDRREDETPVETTVIWPLEVELELLEAAHLPKAEGVRSIGSDRRARLSGRIFGESGEPVAGATVELLHGSNAGRTLTADSDGAFGATDLYPGMQIVEVRGPGIFGSKREIQLRSDADALLNIGYGRPGYVAGEVVDEEGEPIQGAVVEIDGQEGYTDVEGAFFCGPIASGRGLALVHHDDYADHREILGVTSGMTIPRGRIRFVLREPATLDLKVDAAPGAPGDATVFVMPANPAAQRRFPWHTISPFDMRPGTTRTIEGLPPEVASIRVFHPGAVASPQNRHVNLRGRAREFVEIDLEPTDDLTGVVLLDGEPVPDCPVSLEAPDRTDATLSYLKVSSFTLQQEVFPTLPIALQTQRTDERGRFHFTAWSDIVATRYLVARTDDGLHRAAKLVEKHESEVTLRLEPVELERATLVLELPERTQGLPIEVFVDGSSVREDLLAPDEPLVVPELLAGVWRLHVRWRAHRLLDVERLELGGGEVTRRLELPEGAITGQDPETWRRAGREYPD